MSGETPVTTFELAADAIAAAAGTLHHPERLDEVLEKIATATRNALPEFDLVGISTLNGKNVVSGAATDSTRNARTGCTPAATAPKVDELDKLQYSEDEGACVDALGKAHLVLAPELR